MLLVAACWAMHRELAGLHPRDVLAQLEGYGWRHAALGLATAAASFVVLGLIELTALRRATTGEPRKVVPRRAAMLTAFVANAVSQSVGLALLTGAAIRQRAYARYGLDAGAVARATGLVTLATTLGLVAASAGALLASTEPLHVHGAIVSVRPLGGVLALLVLTYLVWSIVGHSKTLGRGRWSLPTLPFRQSSRQLALSVLDWLLTATVLFAFVPAALGLGFWSVLRAYMIAQVIGVTSHVPAGAGVLEFVLLALLAGAAPAAARAAVVASLVMFRVVYYLVPLVAAMIVAAVSEFRAPAPLLPAFTEGVGAR